MIDIAKVERLMALMAQYGVDVVDAQGANEKIALARNAGQQAFFGGVGGAQAPGVASSGGGRGGASAVGSNAQGFGLHAAPPSAVQSDTAGTPPAAVPAPAKVPEGTTLTSPFVGTFYRAPSPDAPTFVEVGARVRKGQTLCIVEAMKLMNEIESEVDGTVVAILLENGKSVEFGTPLFVVAP
jgi:acetyl-CoA carboxylase biotin carboxyl carrier protein